MSDANKMKIICNPFKKEIEYQWYDSNLGNYRGLKLDSPLLREEFTNTTIQNRAYDIIKIINNRYKVGNVGLEINFVGTEDDYSDLCSVILNYYEDSGIKCIKDDRYYNTASFVMPKIKEKFSKIKTTLEKYTEDAIAKLVDKYNDAVKPSVSLCVMGLYSAGKSAFINSIIGAELLPSASDPTTAKVCKIHCDKKYQIQFKFDDKECVLTFEGKKYKPNRNFDDEIIQKLQEIVKGDGQHDEIFHMNRALEIINNYKNDKHQISDIIEMRIPFIHTVLPTKECDFIIYDTPGSNSDNNEQHFEVLKNSLDKQTNALPIFLTTPDTMDAKDNGDILRLIEEEGNSLDTTNAIVVVNKADEKPPSDLGKKIDKVQSLRITKWKSTRIFFLSSLIAIASKKRNPDKEEEWLDEGMFYLYDEKESKYTSDDRKLFEFNIVDKSKADEITAYKDSKKTTHLYKNSGLEAIEKEIVEYARKYALYNKCQQSSEYLQNAIDLCVENVQEAKDKLDKEFQKAEGYFNLKEKELCNKLKDKKKDLSSYNTDFQKLMSYYFADFTRKHHLTDDSDDKYELQDELKEEWKRLKEEGKTEKKDISWTFSQIQRYVYRRYSGLLMSFSGMINEHIVSFWDRKSYSFKNGCIEIVHDSDALTDEQKSILESVVLSKKNMFMYEIEFDLRKVGAIRNKKFLFWERKSEKFDVKACRKQLVNRFNDAVRKRISVSESGNERNFKEWADNLINTLTAKLCEFNSDLGYLKKEIDALKADIEAKKKCETMLIESKEYIDDLLDSHGGEDDDGPL